MSCTRLRLILLASLFSLPAAAQDEARDGEAAAATAQAAFDAGNYGAAVTSYEALVGAGVQNGQLFYNLGTAYDRQGQAGDAVAAFLGARRLLPRDPDVAANLRLELGKVHDQLEATAPSSLESHVSTALNVLTVKEWGWLTAILGAVVGVILTLTQLWRRLAAVRKGSLVLLALPLAAFGLTLAADKTQEVWGAVRVKESKVYSGPGLKNPVVFTLREGAPILLEGHGAGGYFPISLSDGKRGWISEADVRVF